ncbi:MAG: hypothetical protein Q4A11_03810 [Brachymonas sp.]|nr:hypothetical protein [Brachymonas sp.]
MLNAKPSKSAGVRRFNVEEEEVKNGLIMIGIFHESANEKSTNRWRRMWRIYAHMRVTLIASKRAARLEGPARSKQWGCQRSHGFNCYRKQKKMAGST